MRKIILLVVALLPSFVFNMNADENPEKNLTFSNCGAYITVSEVDDNN